MYLCHTIMPHWGAITLQLTMLLKTCLKRKTFLVLYIKDLKNHILYWLRNPYPPNGMRVLNDIYMLLYKYLSIISNCDSVHETARQWQGQPVYFRNINYSTDLLDLHFALIHHTCQTIKWFRIQREIH